MTGRYPFPPLSPPKSPHNLMSTNAAIVDSAVSQQQRHNFHEASDPSFNKRTPLAHPGTFDVPLGFRKRPAPLTHIGFRQSPRTFDFRTTQEGTVKNNPDNLSGPHSERYAFTHFSEVGSSELPAKALGGSAPVSPSSSLAPLSPSHEKIKMGDEFDDLVVEDEEVEEGEDSSAMTAEQLRAQKRKMKRFRLTHNQTRFLMSEFVRQAHPDAAHRERLAREIPGLSPRQVQVWFQNRRAKLKRLTIEDRERIMRSRALPEDFDASQALHSPFSATSADLSGAPSEPYAPAFSERPVAGYFNTDITGRLPENALQSPTSMNTAPSGIAFSPEHLGSDASLAQMHHWSTVNWANHPASPLRSSASHDSSGNLNGAHLAATPGGSFGNERPRMQRASSNPSGPYGLGYSHTSIPGFQSSASSRGRSLSGNMPRRIELGESYQPMQGHTPGAVPQTATFPSYSYSALSMQESFQASYMSAPHHITSFQESYLRQNDCNATQFPPCGPFAGDINEDDKRSATGFLQY